ncbi:hypothetical protein [Streptosporangium sp. KLBMP 9127]|nr:hypothetical protein [Streptosporangium sp. KLBMP 9127]
MPQLPSDVESTPWNPPSAAGVPRLRAAMARQMRTPHEIANTAALVASGKGSIVPPALDPG